MNAPTPYVLRRNVPEVRFGQRNFHNRLHAGSLILLTLKYPIGIVVQRVLGAPTLTDTILGTW